MTVRIYEHLAALNTGFDQVRRSLAALARYREFDRPTLVQFNERAEARAATNSYLASVIEAAETAEAGRRFGKRRAREEAEEGTERG